MRASHHPDSGRRTPARERGVTLVEAAFALPVFILFLFGLVDLGLAVLQTSQTSSAAADGARAASVVKDLTGAETAGPAHDKIVNAVRARLVGADDVVITISCRTASGSVYTCGTEGALRDRARIRVEVSLTFEPATFVGASLPIENIRGTASMGLVDLPVDLPVTPTTTTITSPTP